MSTFGSNWWLFFNLALAICLFVDLRLLRKRTRNYHISGFWLMLALLFAGLLYVVKGHEVSLTFVTGYVIEESLSIDNLFIFLLIFRNFQVPQDLQPRILMNGIIGALIFRFLFIFAGVSLIHKFHWLFYLFGALLIITGCLLLTRDPKKAAPKLFLGKILKKVVPISDEWAGDKLLVRQKGKLFATPALVVLMAIESTDIIFALDSIPAIFAITLEPFLVYSSCAMAMLGLRSLFFVLQDLFDYFHHLHYGVSIILIFIGLKMVLERVLQVPTAVSLGVVAAILFISILSSHLSQRRAK